MNTPGRPAVSVIVPAHNRADVIGRALDSVRAQTFQDYEVIVVDDASSDGLGEVLSRRADGRVHLVRLRQRRGAARARNAALPETRGEWIAFLDSDDEWLPDKLTDQLAAVERGSYDAVYCTCLRKRAGEEPAVRPKGVLAEGDIIDSLLLRRHAPTPSVYMVRRTAFARVRGFDESFPSAADIDLWLRLATSGCRFAAVQEPLAVKHDLGTGQMKQDAAGKAIGFRRMVQRWGPLARERLGDEAYRRWLTRRARKIERKQEAALAAFAATGDRRDALQYARRMAAALPWSAGYIARALSLAAGGPTLYSRVAVSPSASTIPKD
jgi:glycosyltransferase involved in cell wall biosynthesis